MAKPDLDDGYLRLAHELFAAVCCAGFTKWEMVVVREVFDQIYGPHKFKTVRLSPTAMAMDVSTYKQSIHRAIETLVKSNVLVKVDGHEFAFVKDYERWTRGGKPRFSEFESRFFSRQKRSVRSNKPVNNGADTDQQGQSTTALTDKSKPSTTALTPTGKPIASTTALTVVSAGADGPSTVALTGVSAGADANDVPPRPPIEERAPKNELRINKEPDKKTSYVRSSGLRPPRTDASEELPRLSPEDEARAMSRAAAEKKRQLDALAARRQANSRP